DRLDQHREELAGITGDVQVLPAALADPGIIIFTPLFKSCEQGIERWCHVLDSKKEKKDDHASHDKRHQAHRQQAMLYIACAYFSGKYRVTSFQGMRRFNWIVSNTCFAFLSLLIWANRTRAP